MTMPGGSRTADRVSLTAGAGERQGEASAEMASPSERHARGKSLRDAVPCEAHAGWKAPDNRRDPIEVLLESNHGRIPDLIPIRFGRMMHPPFTFYRGAAAIMAADRAATAQSGLRVQACGDAHLLNFGGFATPERKIAFDINDFDETLPAPWEWDLKRLTASIVIAARDLKLSGTDAAHAARATACSYSEHMTDYFSRLALEIWYEAVAVDDVAAVIGKRVAKRVATKKERSAPAYVFPKLVVRQGATPRFKNEPPLIFNPTEALGVTSGFHKPLAAYRASLPAHVRFLFDRCRLCDVAVKVVGVGSVGTMCCVGRGSQRTTVRCSCRSRRPARRCLSHMPAQAPTPITARGPWPVST